MSSTKSVSFVIPPVAEICCFVGPSETGAVRTDGAAGRMGVGKLDATDKTSANSVVKITPELQKQLINLLIIKKKFT